MSTKKFSNSVQASHTFIIPNKDGMVRFISDFRFVTKYLVRNPNHIPKISDAPLQKIEITYATSLDLNMGYYTLMLDPDSQKICTMITS